MSGPSGRRAASDIVIQVAGRLANLVLGIVVTLLLVRALGDEGFGQWSTILAIVQIAAYFGELGLEQVAVRAAAADPEEEPRWLGALLSLRLAIAVPAVILAAIVVVVVERDTEMVVAGILLSGTLLAGGASAARAAFQLRTRNDVTTAVVTANSLLWGAAVIALAAGGASIVPFAAAFLVVQTLTTLGLVVLAFRRARFTLRGSTRHWPELARLGIPVGIAGLLTLAYGRIDQVLVFELAGARDAGLYGAVYRILDQAQFIPIAAMTTLFPMIAAAHPADPARLKSLLQSTAEFLAVGSLAALAVTIPLHDPLVELLFGAEFAAAGPALPVLMGAYVLICFGYLSGNLVIVLGLQRRFVRYALIALVVNVALNLLLVPTYGFMAAAWITLLTEALVLVLAGRAVLGALDFRPRVGRLARIAAAAAVTCVLVEVLELLHAPLPLELVAAVGIYGAAVILLGGIVPAEVRSTLRRA